MILSHQWFIHINNFCVCENIYFPKLSIMQIFIFQVDNLDIDKTHTSNFYFC